MTLTVYNTLTRSKEEFVPLEPGRVRIYVCGPTVYGHSHLGHAKSYVSFDVIVRYLRFLGFDVLYVQNITDVGHLSDDADEGEDKIEKLSQARRVHPMQIAEQYTRSYFEDMDALNVLRPDISPHATGHIIEQIEMVKRLLELGFAYEVNGSVYFDVQKFPSYGKLSGRNPAELEAGARIEVNPEKRHPADFALWKKAGRGHIMRWPSPWGEGFPGWHIECSAMSMKYLGASFDIHGGGLENQFPHHECEIAQSEASTGGPFVKYWLHNNMVTVDGRKMGKSLGNFITLKDAFQRWSPQVVRFFILQSHYRSTLDFSEAALEGAAKGLERLNASRRAVHDRLRTATDQGTVPAVDLARHRQAFLDAMNDDFNSPQAVAALFELSRELNAALAAGTPIPAAFLREAETLYDDLAGRVLGITLEGQPAPRDGEQPLEARLMDLLINLRSELRAQKLWPLADLIRTGLNKAGVALEDGKQGTTWKRLQ
ncbi:MAG TPA: cysteine--tRNA ligase [Bacteroidota bacterium]